MIVQELSILLTFQRQRNIHQILHEYISHHDAWCCSVYRAHFFQYQDLPTIYVNTWQVSGKKSKRKYSGTYHLNPKKFLTYFIKLICELKRF